MSTILSYSPPAVAPGKYYQVNEFDRKPSPFANNKRPSFFSIISAPFSREKSIEKRLDRAYSFYAEAKHFESGKGRIARLALGSTYLGCAAAYTTVSMLFFPLFSPINLLFAGMGAFLFGAGIFILNYSNFLQGLANRELKSIGKDIERNPAIKEAVKNMINIKMDQQTALLETEAANPASIIQQSTRRTEEQAKKINDFCRFAKFKLGIDDRFPAPAAIEIQDSLPQANLVEASVLADIQSPTKYFEIVRPVVYV